MKLLPCFHCRTFALQVARPQPIAWALGSLAESSFTFICLRCKTRNVLSSAEFTRLPTATLVQLADAGTDLDIEQVVREEAFIEAVGRRHDEAVTEDQNRTP